MTAAAPERAPILVVGAGIMGTGIAQVAAQAGHPVRLHDARPGAAHHARAQLGATLDALVAKGRLAAPVARATLDAIAPLDALEPLPDVRLVVEAIVEDLAQKRALLERLEPLLDADCLIASNTSSLSITALARGLADPGRLVGMHFFNPVPQMKLVEVVSGLQTRATAAAAVFDLARTWGKEPVHARSTPGFIVNRIARPYYAEALGLLTEQATTPAVLDACLRGAGFRMGPCELMDLIGHDTNFAVTRSVYEANFHDRRYAPSPLQCAMVDGGLLGRKSGRGFYRYPADAPAATAPPEPPATATAGVVAVHGDGPLAEQLAAAVARLPAVAARPVGRVRRGWTGLAIDGGRLVLAEGRCAYQLARDLDTVDVAVFDRPTSVPPAAGAALAFAVADGARGGWRVQAAAWLGALGFTPWEVADTPGLIVARTIAMLVNEAADAVHQGVCSREAADAAMRLGVNYPLGPFEWLARWSAGEVAALLDALDHHYRGERYRVSPWLRRQAAAPPTP